MKIYFGQKLVLNFEIRNYLKRQNGHKECRNRMQKLAAQKYSISKNLYSFKLIFSGPWKAKCTSKVSEKSSSMRLISFFILLFTKIFGMNNKYLEKHTNLADNTQQSTLLLTDKLLLFFLPEITLFYEMEISKVYFYKYIYIYI